MGDIRLDDFMRVCTDIELPDGKPATMRVLSDIELNARRDYALEVSVRITEQLKDPNSELHRLKIKPVEDFTLDSLLGIVSEDKVSELVREAKDVFRVDFFPEPEKPSEKEVIETRSNQAKHEREIAEAQSKHVLTGLQTYRDKFIALDRATQVKEVQARAVWVYAASSAQDAEVYYTVWCAVERDGGKVWKSPEDVQKLDRRIIDRLYKEYKELDAIDPWALTKSQSERTPDRLDKKRLVGKRHGKRTARPPLAVAVDLRDSVGETVGTGAGISST